VLYDTSSCVLLLSKSRPLPSCICRGIELDNIFYLEFCFLVLTFWRSTKCPTKICSVVISFKKYIIKSVFKFGGKFNQDLSNLENFNIIGKLRNPKQTL
jgi:hypothetical protein